MVIPYNLYAENIIKKRNNFERHCISDLSHCISKDHDCDRDHPDYERQVKYQKLQHHIDNLLVERVFNISSFRYSLQSGLYSEFSPHQ